MNEIYNDQSSDTLTHIFNALISTNSFFLTSQILAQYGKRLCFIFSHIFVCVLCFFCISYGKIHAKTDIGWDDERKHCEWKISNCVANFSINHIHTNTCLVYKMWDMLCWWWSGFCSVWFWPTIQRKHTVQRRISLIWSWSHPSNCF